MEKTNANNKSNNRQPIRLMSNLKKISDLDLNERKTSVMQGSIFYSLSKVRNKKEQSGTLVEALCRRYDATKKLFVFNDRTSFGFCTTEVARVLRLKDIGTDFNDYEKLCSTDEYPRKFPNYMYELRERFSNVSDRSKQFSAVHLKDILRNMVVEDDDLMIKELRNKLNPIFRPTPQRIRKMQANFIFKIETSTSNFRGRKDIT